MARKSGPRNFDSSEIDRKVSITKMTNDERRKCSWTRFRTSILLINSSFVIRIPLGPAHLRDFRKAEHVIENFLPRRRLDFFNRNRVRHVKPAGFQPAQ